MRGPLERVPGGKARCQREMDHLKDGRMGGFQGVDSRGLIEDGR